MATWNTIPQDETIGRTIEALQQNNINALVVSTGQDAKNKVLSLIPKGSEVMDMTSVTLETIGLDKAIKQSGNYEPVKLKLSAMDRATQQIEMQKLGAAPVWVIGSVQAVTQDGHVFVASNTGSQLPAYAYGSSQVIWVVGAQKIVSDNQAALKRIYEYALPLESDRAKKAYGVAGSAVNKLLIINKEIAPGRISLIFVKEVLGF